MRDDLFGKVLIGNINLLKKSFEEFSSIPVDLEIPHEELLDNSHLYRKTISEPVELSTHGTFDYRFERKIRFEPTDRQGWWFKRTDMRSEPVKVSHRNVYTVHESGVHNIVLRQKGGKQNYVRLIEHIIAIKLGLGIDDVMILVDSDDPPLFDYGAMPILDALEKVDRKEKEEHGYCSYFKVKETVSAVWPNGALLVVTPPDRDFALKIDCAVNFQSCIGKQRIKFAVNEDTFKMGAGARTNSSLKHAVLCKTIGKLIPSVRYLGYNRKNVLVAGKKKYFNRARLKYRGKSLEAVWHRAALDLLAAFALIEEGRFVGNIISYKANHRDDVDLVRELYKQNLLTEVKTI